MSRVLPILFNTEMVRAILDGRKTVTRRIIKGLPEGVYRIEQTDEHKWEALYGVYNSGMLLDMYSEIKPPYQPGDILYVRETWNKAGNGYIYKADWIKDGLADIAKWRPSIHMPREAARLFLKVTDVRVERLQEMWASDVSKEGLQFNRPRTADEMLMEFANLWNSTLKKSDLDRYGWDANSWVWVIEFERCEKMECKSCLCQKCDNDDCEWCRCQKNSMEMECYTNDCNYYFNEQEDIDEGLLDFGPGWSSGGEFGRCEKPESDG